MMSLADGAIRRTFASYRARSKAVPVVFRSGLGRSEGQKVRLAPSWDGDRVDLYGAVKRDAIVDKPRRPKTLALLSF